MPTAAQFESYTGEQISALLRANKHRGRPQAGKDYDTAVEYLDNRQRGDIKSQLQLRYSATQEGGRGQDIEAVVLPLVERFIAESATAYSEAPTRTIKAPDGAESDEAKTMTEALDRELGRAHYNDKLDRVDQLMSLGVDSGVWYKARAGKLSVIVTPSHLIAEVPPTEDQAELFDPTEQDDYSGYSIQLHDEVAERGGESEKKTWLLLTPATHAIYLADDPYSPESFVNTYDNHMQWSQTVDSDDHNGTGLTALRPLQMFTIWAKKSALDGVFTLGDPDLLYLNREINIKWSIMLDSLGHQSWDTNILKTMDPTRAPPIITGGPRHAVVLGPEDSLEKLGTPTPFTSIVDVFKTFAQTMAVSKRQNPGEYTTDGVAAQSGFAKLVESLPKLEARRERTTRLKQLEEQIGWPRIAAIGVELGWDGFTSESVQRNRLEVEFAEPEFPRTVDEISKEAEYLLKHHLTTPAKLLADHRGIDIEQARIELEENRAEAAQAPQPQAQQEQQPQAGSALGALISRRQR